MHMCPVKERGIFFIQESDVIFIFFFLICVCFLWEINCVIEKKGIWYDILVNVFNKFEGNIIINKIIIRFFVKVKV